MKPIIPSLILVACTAAIITIGFDLADKIDTERRTRDDQVATLESRTAALEQHFIGHTVVLAKDGKGIQIIPCKLNIDKECYRDDHGITLSNLYLYGWRVGIETMGNGVKHTQRDKTGPGTVSIKDSTVDGQKFNYEGPNNWRFRLAEWWLEVRIWWAKFWLPELKEVK